MKHDSLNTRNSKGRPRTRLGTKVLSIATAFTLAMSMCPAVYASDGFVDMESQVLVGEGEGAITVTGNTHSMSTGEYRVTGNVTINPDGTGNGIKVENGAKVLLYIEEGTTLTVNGKNAEGNGIGYAAILLPEGSTLTIAGKGMLNATGGNAGNGSNGDGAEHSFCQIFWNPRTGKGGSGGQGGGGAGAGIGTNGGTGGSGGAGGEGVGCSYHDNSNTYGNDGRSGSAGSAAAPAGTLIVTGSVTMNAKGGSAGKGGSGGSRGRYEESTYKSNALAASTSGGGGGGAGGSAADGIGSGGTGGGGGGGGASGNIDGEADFAILYPFPVDIDDLWGYGGYGGSGTWGGGSGSRGDYGASNGGDDTGASIKYAKAGGAGGSCANPRTVAFYTYKSNSSDNPKVACTSGHGVTRSATSLGTLQEFMNKGGSLVSGGTVEYDGKQHGVSVGGSGKSSAKAGSSLQTQEDDSAIIVGESDGFDEESSFDDAGDWDEAGVVGEASDFDEADDFDDTDDFDEESFTWETSDFDEALLRSQVIGMKS